MFELVRGPLVWFGLLGFVAGAIFTLGRGLWLARKDKVVYPYISARFGLRSVLHWIVPFSSRSMRLHPLFTLVSFAFHICLLVCPLFVVGHAVLWDQSWGIRWWSLPGAVAETMTVVVIFGGVAFLLRRIAAPEVRNVTTVRDYALLAIVIAPFVTGLLAHHQWLPYRTALTLHIVSGVLWLVAIPFTRLSHMLWFVFTRSYMGSEFGAVRSARDW